VRVLTCLRNEPLPADEPILKLDNVILAPHTLCWTDECFSENGRVRRELRINGWLAGRDSAIRCQPRGFGKGYALGQARREPESGGRPWQGELTHEQPDTEGSLARR